MWKNKLRYVWTILMLSLLLGGCDAATDQTLQKRKVAVITKSTESTFFKSVFAGANAAATAYNIEIRCAGPDNEEDYETQNEMVQKAVEDGYEAIVFSAIDYDANREAIDEAAKQGVKIISIDSDVNSKNVACRIGTDNFEAGKMAAKEVLKSKEEALHIGIVNFDEHTENGQERERGFRTAIEESERTYDIQKINVISTVDNAKEGTKQLLQEHPEINVLVTFNEWTSLGVGYAVEEMKLDQKLHVVVFDNNIVSVGMMETGEVDSLIVQNPYAMGYLGIENAYKALNGILIEQTEVRTETIAVTRENMYEDACQKALFLFE